MKRLLLGAATAAIVLSGVSAVAGETSSTTLQPVDPPTVASGPDYLAIAQNAAGRLTEYLRFEEDGRVWVAQSEDSACSSWGSSLVGMAANRYNQLASDGLAAEQIATMVGAYWDGDEESRGYAVALGDRGRPGTSRYIDDGMWAAQLRVLQHDHQVAAGQVPDQTAIPEAQTMLDLALRNYDPDTGLVFWKDQRQERKKPVEQRSHSRSTVSTAGAIELALMINASVPGGPRYRDNLEFAMEAYDNLRRSMRDQDNLYFDGVHADGTVNRAKYPYVQGMMLHIGGLLHAATGQPAYLAEAERTVVGALRFYHPEHLVTSDQMFVAIFFDRLYEFRAMTTDEQLRADIVGVVTAHAEWYVGFEASPVEAAPYGFRSAQLHMASVAALLQNEPQLVSTHLEGDNQ